MPLLPNTIQLEFLFQVVTRTETAYIMEET